MQNLEKITILGLIFGMLGTTLGGFIGAFLPIHSNKLLSFVLEFAAGLMTAIICFDLIPESIQYSNLNNCLIGLFIGVIAMFFCDELIKKINFDKKIIQNNSLFKAGMVICIGLAIHNFPERFSYWFWL